MTKVRMPGSFADAMIKVMAQIGATAAAKAVERAERTIYEWANPDSGTLPSLLDALALDTAHRLAGGEGAPFCDAFSHQLGIKVDQEDACRRQLVADSIDFVREAGELTSALFSVSQPGASPLDHHRALVEAQQVDGVLRRIRRRLPNFLRPAMSTGPRNAGGTHQ